MSLQAEELQFCNTFINAVEPDIWICRKIRRRRIRCVKPHARSDSERTWGFGQKTRLNLGEVVVRNGITLLRLRILSHGVDVFVYACEPQPLRG